MVAIFVNTIFFIFIKISLKFVPKGPIDNDLMLIWFTDAYIWNSVEINQLLQYHKNKISWHRPFSSMSDLRKYVQIINIAPETQARVLLNAELPSAA